MAYLTSPALRAFWPSPWSFLFAVCLLIAALIALPVHAPLFGDLASQHVQAPPLEAGSGVTIALAKACARLPGGPAAPLPTLWRIAVPGGASVDAAVRSSCCVQRSGPLAETPPPKIVLEDGAGGSDRGAAAEAMLAALLAGGPGAIAVVAPPRADLDARVAARVATFSADKYFTSAKLMPASPLDLAHELLALLHWPSAWDEARCCISDVTLRDASRALASVTVVPGGVVLQARGGSAPRSGSSESFDAVGRKQNPVSDKIAVHAYGALYEEVLSPVRARAAAAGVPVRLLEIGLGCGMPYGEGAGPLLWRAYFGPTLKLAILEFDEACALAWGAREPNAQTAVYTGDQRNATLLRHIIDVFGPFDVVVDDGGHCLACQVAAADVFPSGLAPGGVLVIEDLFASLTLDLGSDAPPATLGALGDLADSLIARDLRYDDATRVRVATRDGARPAALANAVLLDRIVCEPEICALVRAL